MREQQRGIMKMYMFVGILVILAMACISYTHTGSFVEGIQPAIQEKVVEPIGDKAKDKMDEMLEDTGVYEYLG